VRVPSAFAATAYSTPGTHTYTVPADVNSIVVKMWGAGGQNASDYGGGGGYTGATIAVSPGDVLRAVVGGLNGTYGGGSGHAGGGNGGGYSGLNG
jgi:hypothetical protein